ncbi:MAG: hypothetical protein DLM73_12700 [Chthoniobacterales bacterium]|nr:MAG: hypothetical protein DLM73_12700 [Chthoniobacterales bacterium]
MNLSKLAQLAIGFLFILIGAAIEGQPSPTPAAAATATPPPPACVAPEFRQFDFWIGRWKVTNPKGVQVGTSEITRQSEGCAIREQWLSAHGTGGTSINYYDEADRQWHQDWVGGDGTILHLHGGLVDGAMVISGETKSAKGPYLNRITYTPLADGKVKQEWTISSDGGKTWQTTFLGIYEKQ